MARKIENSENAYFIQRLGAFVIDFFLVYLVASLITSPFVDAEKTTSLAEHSTEIMNQYMEESIDEEVFITEYKNIAYQSARLNGTVTFVTIVLNICYYVVFQVYRKGQTIGKKWMRIQVVSLEGDLTMNQMIFRAFLSNSILSQILGFLFMIFSPKDVYFYAVGMVEIIQFIIIFISIIMVLNKNNGRAVHDMIAHTKVIRI